MNCDKHHGPNKRSQGMFNVLHNFDLVPSNVQCSHQEALLYVFEDNEAVIKMSIKGRSPTMRHDSRTHRVALDWLFDIFLHETLPVYCIPQVVGMETGEAIYEKVYMSPCLLQRSP